MRQKHQRHDQQGQPGAWLAQAAPVRPQQQIQRLRYQQKRLLKQLQALEEFATLTKILFKVQPPTAERRAAGRTISLSDSAAENIQATADSISDPKLRAALERLAKHRQSEQ